MTNLLLALFACAPDNKPSVYNEPPEATITSPGDGAELMEGAVVTLTGAATDREDTRDGVALSVAWYAGDAEICAGTVPDADGLITCDWAATEGTAQLRLIVTDAANETATDAVSVTVTANEPPSITLESPSEDGEYYFDDAVTLEATVSDAESAAEDLVVSWSSDVDGELGEAPVASSGTSSTAVMLSEGPHVLTATVTDPGGNTDLATVQITVFGANTAPDCEIQSPADGTAVALGEGLLFTGVVSDQETAPTALSLALASHLEDITDEVPVDDEGAFTYPWTPTVAGTHVVTLTGEDSRGETCTDVLTIEVCDTAWYYDGDGDGHGDPELSVVSCEAPEGYVATGDDCVDASADVYPGAAYEDSYTDCMLDGDGDGWGDADVPAEVTAGSDCDDGDAAIHPDGAEVCDGADNDCDGTTDGASASDASTWYADTDGDGWGDPGATTDDCDQPSGYVADRTDCDDGDATDHPGATEDCDGDDDDCDGSVDEEGTDTFYADADRDGYGDAGVTTEGCSAPSGYVADATDCDDTDATDNPGATEDCDGDDDDCDGDVDEDGTTVFYADADRDGHGDPGVTTADCSAPSGYVADATDCDDGDADIGPDATEVCDSVDNDCDGDVDDDDAGVDASTGTTFYADADRDGYGDADVTADGCSAPAGYVADATDCDDGDDGVNPGEAEVCEDGVDNDCDGTAGACNTGTHDLASESYAIFRGDSGDYVGIGLAFADDADGDGDQGLWMGGYSSSLFGYQWGYALYAEDLAGSRSLTSVYTDWFYRAHDSSSSGHDIASGGDFDGDGVGDVIIGVMMDTYLRGAGSATVLSGATGSTLGFYYGETDNDYTGSGVALVPDLDGDGLDEVMVASAGTTGTRGRVSLILGGTTTSGSALASSTYYAYFAGEASSDYLGGDQVTRNLAAGDLDGDGTADLVMTSALTSASAGAAYVYYGLPPSGSQSVAGADLILTGTAGSGLGLGPRVVPDLDGDGYDELAVGAQAANRSYVLLGGAATTGTMSATAADIVLSGPTNSSFGYEQAGADLDGDGVGDLLVAAPYDDTNASNAGAVYGWAGPLAAGTLSYTSADLVLLGDDASDMLGLTIELGDYDGDGDLDVATGAHEASSGYDGAIYIWATESW